MALYLTIYLRVLRVSNLTNSEKNDYITNIREVKGSTLAKFYCIGAGVSDRVSKGDGLASGVAAGKGVRLSETVDEGSKLGLGVELTVAEAEAPDRVSEGD